ncbi:MAG: hypothetical protein H6509_04500 [Bryobacterales bacterium]|nr:hypothetical protein [Bryobacterales bacterium]
MPALRFLPFFLLAALPLAAAKAPSESSPSGTYRGRVLTERFRHEQALSRRRAALRAEQVAPTRQDQGDVAILEASDFVIAPFNLFDLQGVTLRFSPSAGGYASAPETVAFDESARANGVTLALDDDDTTRVDLPFAFPYFGAEYSAVWVNSDGNLTFEEGDGLVAARTVARAVAGPPRIAPLFTDLDPSRPAARVRLDSRPDRVFVTWDGVPIYTDAGNGRRQIVQIELSADGQIAFHYLSAAVQDAVAGLFPGRLAGQAEPADFSAGPAGPSSSGLAELFQLIPELDINAAAQLFYRTHDDVYDFLVVFNALGLSAGATAFAYEVNVRNEVLGIGDLLNDEPVFDFGADFGSPKRLASFLNMGPLSNYPSDPTTVIPLIGENSTLSVMGQEAGHRWGVYLEYINPATGLPSTNLLGRDDAHWNFFFNSQASVLEGNQIVDHGEAASPRFETVDAVARYGDLDQYIMGLRAPEDVAPSFVVLNPRNAGSTSRGRRPQTGVRFDGDRQDITVDLIEAAEGPRTPDHTVAQREIRFAFILLVAEGAQPNASDVAKLDRIRREWEAYFHQAVDQRAVAQTALVNQLRLSAAPAAGILSGSEGPVELQLAAPLADDLAVNISVEGDAIQAPATVTIPAGQTSAMFTVRGVAPGVGVLRAQAQALGFDAPVVRIQTLADPAELTIQIESGGGQDGARGEPLPAPIVVSVRDHNLLPYLGVELTATADNGGAANPASIVTGADGLASVSWSLPDSADPGALHFALAGREAPSVDVLAGDAASRPAFSAAGVVNAASFNQGPAALLRGVSPGGLLSIFGAGLSESTETALSLPLPRSLSGTTVRINGAAAPLLLVSPGQINLQAPFELSGSQARITIEHSAVASSLVTVDVAPTQPGVFTDASTGLAAIVYASDGLSPWNRPARAGEYLQIFATGLGAVQPRAETGEAAPPLVLSRTVAAPVIHIGGRALSPTFSGLTPYFAGLYQINVQLPADLEPGPYELSIETPDGQSNAGLLEVTAP